MVCSRKKRLLKHHYCQMRVHTKTKRLKCYRSQKSLRPNNPEWAYLSAHPIAISAFFCSLVPILFQKMLMFMKADRIAASKDGISIAAAATFIVNVVNTIHDRASHGMNVRVVESDDKSLTSIKIKDCISILSCTYQQNSKSQPQSPTQHDTRPKTPWTTHHPKPIAPNIYSSIYE